MPLGYRLDDHKIQIEESEAKTVRHIFQRYLALKSHRALITELRTEGLRTKVRHLSTGKTIGGIPFTRGPIAYLLRNRFYVGEVVYKGEVLKGEHQPIIDRKLFDTVQDVQSKQRNNHVAVIEKSEALLIGLIYDDRGHRMTPVVAKKNGRQYRYYISSALHQGKQDEAGSVTRVPAEQVEALVVNALKARGLRPVNLNNGRELIRSMHVRVEIAAKTIKISGKTRDDEQHDVEGIDRQFNVSIPWSKRAAKMPRELILPVSQPANAKPKPIRVEDRARLVSAIGRSRQWLRQLQDGSAASTAEIAKSEKCTLRQVNLTLSLAFLSPRLVEAAVTGRLPRGIGITSLRNMPPEWAQQHKLLGLRF